MKKISLIATDLDGTLLNNDKKVSLRTKHLIQQAVKQNVRVVLATTRNLYFVQYLCGMLDLADPVICSNGAHILSEPFGEAWAYHTIPVEVALLIAHIADEHDWDISSTVGAMKYLRQRPQQALGQIAPYVTTVRSNAAGIVGPPLRILVWHPAAIDCFQRLCQTELREYCHMETYYQPDGAVQSLGIFPAGADKGNALALVLRRLNLAADAVLAIGDNDNDLPLFAQASVKVAVGNGTVKLKHQADVIAPDNDSDAVGWAIEQFVLR